ncbi:uncharacterized protein B0H18DRAFT_1122709 [Fomitopsis serialis]|uniref:uncharacterized protein n=1 Tax=Fomitopsis serialis TaxID=139415 RepID=UPI002007897F|nr:uncharacterized protein B0H18DRAFT_1122709 [Neoantrodia serialis]KAH9919011.1 hypothetical protein B0H18DRAFT_1122709 [Neoantrodia serialis]
MSSRHSPYCSLHREHSTLAVPDSLRPSSPSTTSEAESEQSSAGKLDSEDPDTSFSVDEGHTEGRSNCCGLEDRLKELERSWLLLPHSVKLFGDWLEEPQFPLIRKQEHRVVCVSVQEWSQIVHFIVEKQPKVVQFFKFIWDDMTETLEVHGNIGAVHQEASSRLGKICKMNTELFVNYFPELPKTDGGISASHNEYDQELDQVPMQEISEHEGSAKASAIGCNFTVADNVGSCQVRQPFPASPTADSRVDIAPLWSIEVSDKQTRKDVFAKTHDASLIKVGGQYKYGPTVHLVLDVNEAPRDIKSHPEVEKMEHIRALQAIPRPEQDDPTVLDPGYVYDGKVVQGRITCTLYVFYGHADLELLREGLRLNKPEEWYIEQGIAAHILTGWHNAKHLEDRRRFDNGCFSKAVVGMRRTVLNQGAYLWFRHDPNATEAAAAAFLERLQVKDSKTPLPRASTSSSTSAVTSSTADVANKLLEAARKKAEDAPVLSKLAWIASSVAIAARQAAQQVVENSSQDYRAEPGVQFGDSTTIDGSVLHDWAADDALSDYERRTKRNERKRRRSEDERQEGNELDKEAEGAEENRRKRLAQLVLNIPTAVPWVGTLSVADHREREADEAETAKWEEERVKKAGDGDPSEDYAP